MSRLTQEDRDSRRRFDWRLAQRMSRPPYQFTAHKTSQDAKQGRNPISQEHEARHALHYRAKYAIPTLVGENAYSPLTIILIDVSHADYPFAPPAAWVIREGESRLPWSPHFSSWFSICLGTIWRADGGVTLGHFFIHLARLLNWDEEIESGYFGWNPAAVRWWRSHLNRPLTPGLIYPALPADVLYGQPAVSSSAGFQVVSRPVRVSRTGGFMVLRK